MRRVVLSLAFLLAASAPAHAAKPAEIASVIHAAAPYGTGTYSWMWIEAYDATLWTDANSWSMRSPFALSLHYRMHFTAQELADRSIEEMRNIEPMSKDEAAEFDAQLAGVFREVHDGDRITALYIPGKGARLFYNGAHTGDIADDAMAQRFLGIWLSEKTSAPALRKRLLDSGVRHNPPD